MTRPLKPGATARRCGPIHKECWRLTAAGSFMSKGSESHVDEPGEPIDEPSHFMLTEHGIEVTFQ
jgi:hypothetical protein